MKRILWIILIIGVIAGVYVWFFKKETPELAGGVEPEPTNIFTGMLKNIFITGGYIRQSRLEATQEKGLIRNFIQAEITEGKGFIVPVIKKPDVTLTPQPYSPFKTRIFEGMIP